MQDAQRPRIPASHSSKTREERIDAWGQHAPVGIEKEKSAEPKEEEEKKVLTEPIDGVDDQTDASKPKKDIENENELND